MKVGGEKFKKNVILRNEYIINIFLVLIRHGESRWNLENRFTGWTDVDLTTKGELEAKTSGELLKKANFTFDIVFTSQLIRAKQTM